MKGIGKIDGWKVIKREDDAIIWKNDETKQKTGFWKVGLGDGEIGYEVCWNYPKGKISVFEKKDTALTRIKSYMKSKESTRKMKKWGRKVAKRARKII